MKPMHRFITVHVVSRLGTILHNATEIETNLSLQNVNNLANCFTMNNLNVIYVYQLVIEHLQEIKLTVT